MGRPVVLVTAAALLLLRQRRPQRGSAGRRRLNAQTMRLVWAAQADGAMLGDYFSTSWSGGRAVSVFTLASPRGARFNQPLFAAAIRP
jgi:hypothetical protein